MVEAFLLVALLVAAALLHKGFAFRQERERRRLEQERISAETTLRQAALFETVNGLRRLMVPSARLYGGDYYLAADRVPSLETMGDFHYVIDGEAVLLGNVGVKGPETLSLISQILDFLREVPDRHPATILSALNLNLIRTVEACSVACTCARFEGNGVVTIASAGGLLPSVDGGEVTLPPGQPLGVDLSSLYEDHSLVLAPRSVIAFGTRHTSNEVPQVKAGGGAMTRQSCMWNVSRPSFC